MASMAFLLLLPASSPYHLLFPIELTVTLSLRSVPGLQQPSCLEAEVLSCIEECRRWTQTARERAGDSRPHMSIVPLGMSGFQEVRKRLKSALSTSERVGED